MDLSTKEVGLLWSLLKMYDCLLTAVLVGTDLWLEGLGRPEVGSERVSGAIEKHMVPWVEREKVLQGLSEREEERNEVAVRRMILRAEIYGGDVVKLLKGLTLMLEELGAMGEQQEKSSFGC